jgi:hypothetical protein
VPPPQPAPPQPGPTKKAPKTPAAAKPGKGPRHNPGNEKAQPTPHGYPQYHPTAAATNGDVPPTQFKGDEHTPASVDPVIADPTNTKVPGTDKEQPTNDYPAYGPTRPNQAPSSRLPGTKPYGKSSDVTKSAGPIPPPVAPGPVVPPSSTPIPPPMPTEPQPVPPPVSHSGVPSLDEAKAVSGGFDFQKYIPGAGDNAMGNPAVSWKPIGEVAKECQTICGDVPTVDQYTKCMCPCQRTKLLALNCTWAQKMACPSSSAGAAAPAEYQSQGAQYRPTNKKSGPPPIPPRPPVESSDDGSQATTSPPASSNNKEGNAPAETGAPPAPSAYDYSQYTKGYQGGGAGAGAGAGGASQGGYDYSQYTKGYGGGAGAGAGGASSSQGGYDYQRFMSSYTQSAGSDPMASPATSWGPIGEIAKDCQVLLSFTYFCSCMISNDMTPKW